MKCNYVGLLYVLFSASTQRCSIFKNHIETVMLKHLCETRWEVHVNSIKAIRH